MSSYSEEDIRRAAEIREWLVKQIFDKQDEIEKLRVTLTLVDNLLKHGSFREAATLSAGSRQMQGGSPQAQAATTTATTTQLSTTQRASIVSAGGAVAPVKEKGEREDNNLASRPLKRAKDNMLLANTEVSPNSVLIIPLQEVELNVNTPPFKSFFINRILEGMKNKDTERVNHGALPQSDVLDYQVEDENGIIKKIIINNYREKERLNEIFNTSAWVFTRMLEKSDK